MKISDLLENKRQADFERMMAGAMSRKDYEEKWVHRYEGQLAAKRKADFERMMAGAMSRKDFDAKWPKFKK